MKLVAYRWSGAAEVVPSLPSYLAFLRQRIAGPTVVPQPLLSAAVAERHGLSAVYVAFPAEEPALPALLCVHDRDTAAWRRAAAREDECPVCLQPPRDRTGPLDFPWPTPCTHWACRECWRELHEHGRRTCPVCRCDATRMLERLAGDAAPLPVRVPRGDAAGVPLRELCAWAAGPRGDALWLEVERQSPRARELVRYRPGPDDLREPVVAPEDALEVLNRLPLEALTEPARETLSACWCARTELAVERWLPFLEAAAQLGALAYVGHLPL